MHGWYSQKMAKVAGSVHYKTADGKIVELTVVSRTMEHGCKWDDLQYIGEVVQFVDRVSDGEFDGFYKLTFDKQIQRLGEILEKLKSEEKDPKDKMQWN